jgi:hypothetical protein
MSIILEALKKAAKEDPLEKRETEKTCETTEPGLKKQEAKMPDLNLRGLIKSTLISLGIIAIGGLPLFYLLRERDLTVAEKIEPRAQPTSFILTEKSAPEAGAAASPDKIRAEGYIPVNIFKEKALDERLTLNGIVSGIGKPAAIIDNKIVEEGASIKSSRVVKIYSDKVELRNESSGEIFTLRVY